MGTRWAGWAVDAVCHHCTETPLKFSPLESSFWTYVLLSDARRACGWIPAHVTIFFFGLTFNSSLLHPPLPPPTAPQFPKEDPAASSLFILICLWVPPSASDQGRNWHLLLCQNQPYIFFNLTGTQTPNLQIKGKSGLWDDQRREEKRIQPH